MVKATEALLESDHLGDGASPDADVGQSSARTVRPLAEPLGAPREELWVLSRRAPWGGDDGAASMQEADEGKAQRKGGAPRP